MALAPGTSRASSYLEGYETSGYVSGADKGSSLRSGVDNQFSNASWADTWAMGSPSDLRNAALNQSAGRSYSRSSAVPTTQTTRTVRKGEAPEVPDMPTYVAPELDKRKVRALTQKMAAPGVRTLRESVQQAMGRNYDNPNVRKMTLREALQGYGTGLESVMAGAGKEARSESMAELDLKRQESYANWQQQSQAAMASYQNAWADYMKGTETITESKPTTNEGVMVGGNTYKYTRNPVSGQIQPIF